MNRIGALLHATQQPAMSLTAGLVCDYGGAALAALSAQRRVMNRLDWWRVEEWAGSDAFVAVGRDHQPAGAMLVAPLVLHDMNKLASARASVAWLRWCAVRDGMSATQVIRPMFERSCSALREAGIADVFCLTEPAHWFTPYARDLGFKQVDSVVTLELSRADWTAVQRAKSVRPAPGLSVRPIRQADLPAVLAIDSSAFEEEWRLSADMLARAGRAAAVCVVAELAGDVLGYALASQRDDEAHVTRLAVQPRHQGRGIGAALLGAVIHELIDPRGVRSITLNTQTSNVVSLNLYTRFGFQTTHPLMRVMWYDLAASGHGMTR